MLRISVATIALFVAAGCGSQPSDPEADAPAATQPQTAVEAEPAINEVYTDDMGVQRAKLDPGTVKTSQCRVVKDDYTSIGQGIQYRVESTFRAKNVSTLTGTLSLTVQYQNADGDAVAEEITGANNIRPEQSAKILGSTGVEKGDLPDSVVKCEVVEAELYVPTG